MQTLPSETLNYVRECAKMTFVNREFGRNLR
jgi:hypothetical protein